MVLKLTLRFMSIKMANAISTMTAKITTDNPNIQDIIIPLKKRRGQKQMIKIVAQMM